MKNLVRLCGNVPYLLEGDEVDDLAVGKENGGGIEIQLVSARVRRPPQTEVDTVELAGQFERLRRHERHRLRHAIWTNRRPVFGRRWVAATSTHIHLAR